MFGILKGQQVYTRHFCEGSHLVRSPFFFRVWDEQDCILLNGMNAHIGGESLIVFEGLAWNHTQASASESCLTIVCVSKNQKQRRQIIPKF